MKGMKGQLRGHHEWTKLCEKGLSLKLHKSIVTWIGGLDQGTDGGVHAVLHSESGKGVTLLD